MDKKKILKSIMIAGGMYVLADLSFHYGKGYMLRTLKKHDVTADDIINNIELYSDSASLRDKLIFKIVIFGATLNDE